MSPEKQKPEAKLTKRGKLALGVTSLVATGATLYGAHALIGEDNRGPEHTITHVVEPGETLSEIVKEELKDTDTQPEDYREVAYSTLHDPENADEFGYENPSSGNLGVGEKIEIKVP